MNLLDVAFVLVLVLSVVGGIVRGLIREVLGFAGLVAGFILAVLFAPVVAPHLQKWMVHAAAYAVAFLGVFFLTIAIAALLGHVLTRFVETLHLSWLNRLAGGAFGLVRGAILIIVLFWGLLYFVERPDRLLEKSKLAPLVYRGARWFGTILPGSEPPGQDEMI